MLGSGDVQIWSTGRRMWRRPRVGLTRSHLKPATLRRRFSGRVREVVDSWWKGVERDEAEPWGSQRWYSAAKEVALLVQRLVTVQRR